MLASLVLPDEASGLQVATFSQCLHVVCLEREVLGVSSYEQLVLSKGLTHLTSFNFASLKILSSNLVTLEKVRFKEGYEAALQLSGRAFQARRMAKTK